MGLTKLGSMPGGGTIDGIILRLRPGGSEEAILRRYTRVLTNKVKEKTRWRVEMWAAF